MHPAAVGPLFRLLHLALRYCSAAAASTAAAVPGAPMSSGHVVPSAIVRLYDATLLAAFSWRVPAPGGHQAC
jgi:hypothetical protein